MSRTLVVITICASLSLASAVNCAEGLRPAQIESIVHHHLSPAAVPAGPGAPELPPSLWVRITGPDRSVLLIPVHIDSAKGQLRSRGVKAINLPGRQGSADENIGSNCLGLAFFHGMGPTPMRQRPSSVYLIYECFSGYSRVELDSPLLARLKPRASGEGILLDLENGGQLLIYWSKQGHITKMVAPAD